MDCNSKGPAIKELAIESSQAVDRNKRSHLLFRAVSFGVVNRIANAASQVVVVALVVPHLGGEKFGIFAAISGIVAWMSIANLGLGMGLMTQLSNFDGARCRHTLVASTLAASAVASLLAFGLALALWFMFPIGSFLEGLPHETNSATSNITLMAIGSACLLLVFNIGSSALTGYQRGDLAALWRTVAIIIGTAAIALAVTANATFTVLAGVQFGALVLVGVSQFAAAWFFGILRFDRKYFDIRSAWETLKLGSKFLAIQSSTMLIQQTGLMIVATQVSPSEVTPLEVSNRLALLVTALLSVILTPLWPAFGDAFSKRDFTWIRRTFWRSLGVVVVGWTITGTFVGLWGKQIILHWAGPDAVPSSPLLWSVVGVSFMIGLQMPISFLLAGANRLNSLMFIAPIQLVVFLGLAFFLADRMGALAIPLSQLVVYGVISLPITFVAAVSALKDNGKPHAIVI